MTNIQIALRELTLKHDLSEELARHVMNDIMQGKLTDVEITAYLVALAIKNESIAEITGSAQAMLEQAVSLPEGIYGMDIVGTGGDLSNSFNISTTASFLVAAAGIPVVKHGNRAASSKSGTADVFEALGVNIELTPEQAEEVLNEVGQTFIFARKYHPAMKYVAPIRKTLGVRTVFNVLGPLINPSRPKDILLGVYSKHLLVPLAQVLVQLGVERATLIHGRDGLDEVTMTDKTDVVTLRNGVITESVFDPTDYGFSLVDASVLLGGTPVENAKTTQGILDGSIQDGRRDTVIVNAAMAIYTARPELSLAQAIQVTQKLLDRGAGLNQLTSLQKVTQTFVVSED